MLVEVTVDEVQVERARSAVAAGGLMSKSCPVSQAIRAAGFTNVGVGFTRFTYGKMEDSFDLPSAACSIIDAFGRDGNWRGAHPAIPVSFTVDVPEVA